MRAGGDSRGESGCLGEIGCGALLLAGETSAAAGHSAAHAAALARAAERGLLDDELLVTRTGDGAVLGVCGLYPSSFDGGDPDETDLGYRYGRSAWGHGYGFEAAAAVMEWATTARGLERVGSSVQAPIMASHRILQKLGFVFTGTKPVPVDPARTAYWYV